MDNRETMMVKRETMMVKIETMMDKQRNDDFSNKHRLEKLTRNVDG